MARLSQVNKELDIGESNDEIDMETDIEEVQNKRNEMTR